MSYVYGAKNPSLAQEAKSKMKEFEERKMRRRKEWIEELIGSARTEIMLRASLGESSTTFYLEKVFRDLKPIIVTINGKQETYELSYEDKDYLMTEIIRHYSNEEGYPYLSCRPANASTNVIFFGWQLPEMKDV